MTAIALRVIVPAAGINNDDDDDEQNNENIADDQDLKYSTLYPLHKQGLIMNELKLTIK
jgi:hypothetical protein